jgi:hypothetical protein
LDRLAERLASAGTPVSVSTLSNWQRGRTIPATASSRRAVAGLERILRLPAGALTDSLTPYQTSERKLPTRAGLAQSASKRLRASMGLADPGLTIVRLDDDVRVSPGQLDVEVKLVVRAERDGIDRFIAMEHPEAGERPEIEPGPTCRLGELRADEEAGLFAIELLFDEPLTRGELYPVSYRTTGPMAERDGYHGTWIKPGLTYYALTVDFDPAVRPEHVYRVSRGDSESPHLRLGDVRLIHGRFAHLWLTDPPPAFYGLRWDT